MKLQNHSNLLRPWAALLLLTLPVSLRAQFSYTTNNSAITITSFYGSTNNVNIPGTINGHAVTSIANYAFGSGNFTNVTIPASVTSIGPSAFNYCPSLVSFTVDGGNPSYASYGGVLFNQPLTTLIQCPMGATGSYGTPTSVTNIGNEAFQSCSHLTSVSIPNGVINIGDFAFNGCSSLLGAAIPDSVINIGDSAFDFCSSLKRVTMGTNVTSIPEYAFANCTSLTNATLGSGVITIANNAFESCSALTGVVIPNGVTNIGDWAFGYCSSLASAILGTNLASIGRDAFGGSSLASVSIPGSVASIGDFAFDGCPDLNGFTVDGANAYYASVGGVLFNRTLTTLVQYPGGLNGAYAIPDGVTSVGNAAFAYCSGLTSVTLPNSVTTLGVSAFGFCSGLTNVSLPNSVTNLSDYAFSSCYYLRTITIPNSVKTIGFEAFYDCEDLTQVTIGNGVTSLGQYAFEYCTGLHQVRFLGNAPNVNYGPGSADSTVFQGEAGTAYYGSGTTGWGATYGGWSTALYSSPAADFTYVTGSGAVTITGYIGADSEVTIPPVIGGYPVTTLSNHAFYNQTNLTSVTIPSSVTLIGDGAFAGCSNLTRIAVDAANLNYASAGGVLFNKPLTALLQYPAGLHGGYVISNGVTSLGNEAFENCSGLTNVTFAVSVTSIGNQAFANCAGLMNLVIGGGVTNVGNGAFTGCVGLTAVTIPGGVTSLGDGAFGACSDLTSITIPGSVTNVGVGAFDSCSRLTQAYFLGDAPGVDGTDGSVDNSVFANATGTAYYMAGTAGWGATFGGWPTAAVIDPATIFTFITNADDTLTITGYIGTNSDITIPPVINGYPVTLIGDSAFLNQTNLTSVTLADSVTSLGDFAFSGCSGLTNVVIGNQVANIGQNAFNSCVLLAGVTLPDSVVSLGISAFYNCSGLMNVTVGNGVSSLGYWAFYNCTSLTNVTLGSSVTNIDAEAFNSCSGLASVTIPDSVINLGEGAFGDCSSLTNVVMGDSVTTIGEYALGGCSSLTSVMIPASVTSIGDSAFEDCYSLTNIDVDAANPSYTGAGGVLFSKAMTTLIDWPAGLAGSYVIPDSVTNIGDNAFANCSGLTEVVIPARVTGIGSGAFSGCYNLMSFTVSGGNPNYASAGGVLFNQPRTTLLQCPSRLTGGYVIPSGVTNLDAGSFSGCSSLTTVTIPNSVNSIGDSAFQYCYSLTNVTMLNGVTNIGNSAFFYCYHLSSVTIPATVTGLGSWAFGYCGGLKQAYFLGNAPGINGGPGSADSSVFWGESGMAYYAPGTIGWGAFFGGWPTTAGSYLSQPQILGAGGGQAAASQGFQFTLSWATNTVVVVEASSDLRTWTPVMTNTLANGSMVFRDANWTNFPRQFYRARSW